MGLIYDPNDSRNLLSALNANINTADEMISGLKRGSKHLVSALGNKTLSGAAYTAGKGMFSQVVIPTISKASQTLDKLRTDVKQYESFAADAGVELLDEDKLNTQLQSLQAQQVALTGQIGFYNQQALLHLDNSELMFTYKTFGQELSSYMGVTAESIQSIQNKLRQLYQFNTNVSGLFRDIEATFANLSTVISAIGSGKFNSSGKFSMTCSDKDLVRINKFLSSKKSKDKREKKRKGFMIGKLFGKNEITIEVAEKIKRHGSSYTKVNTKIVKKGQGILKGNFTNGKFSGVSIDLGIVSTNLDFHNWNLSSGNTVKFANYEIDSTTSIGTKGLNSSVGLGNDNKKMSYGFETNADWETGLISLYGKNTTSKNLKDGWKAVTNVEIGNKYLNGGQAITAVVAVGALVILIVSAPVALPSGALVTVSTFLGLALSEDKNKKGE